MPRISTFYGIAITINYNDHNPPHFHAAYGEHAAAFGLGPVALVAGSLPKRAREMVEYWARLHQSELLADWELACQRKPLNPIPGLE